jgi:glucose-6-phosphate isomerase
MRLDRKLGILLAEGSLSLPAPSRRTLGDLATVLADPAIAGAEPDRVCYLLYRDVHLDSDCNAFRGHGLHYDITVLLPATYGAELAKTAGHFHSRSASGVPFPGVYEVLHAPSAH